MPHFNQLTLMGNLTKDPTSAMTKNQTQVVDFGLAVSDIYKDQERTLFIDCTMFGPIGESFAKFFKKGSPVLVSGKLQYDQWVDKDGAKHSKHKMIATNWSFTEGKKAEAVAAPVAATVDYRPEPTAMEEYDDVPF